MIYPHVNPQTGALYGRGVCDDKGPENKACVRETSVALILGLAGGFMFEPPKEEGWQMVVSRRPGQPVQLLCPDHNRKVDTADARLVKFGQKG
jgi:hypothetical protein